MQKIHILKIETQDAVQDSEDDEWYFSHRTHHTVCHCAFSTFDELRVYAYQWFNLKKNAHASAIASGRILVDETHHIDVAARPNITQAVEKTMPEMSMVFYRTDGTPRKMYLIGHSSVSTLVLNPLRDD